MLAPRSLPTSWSVKLCKGLARAEAMKDSSHSPFWASTSPGFSTRALPCSFSRSRSQGPASECLLAVRPRLWIARVPKESWLVRCLASICLANKLRYFVGLSPHTGATGECSKTCPSGTWKPAATNHDAGGYRGNSDIGWRPAFKSKSGCPGTESGKTSGSRSSSSRSDMSSGANSVVNLEPNSFACAAARSPSTKAANDAKPARRSSDGVEATSSSLSLSSKPESSSLRLSTDLLEPSSSAFSRSCSVSLSNVAQFVGREPTEKLTNLCRTLDGNRFGGFGSNGRVGTTKASLGLEEERPPVVVEDGEDSFKISPTRASPAALERGNRNAIEPRKRHTLSGMGGSPTINQEGPATMAAIH
mmetsp:Transcript_40133/g.103750  ORF Transcript_40133/g.103750 Transcript_40133/m.103750 type:complete len:361 (+) Transcript_40133:421-1503(+)